MLCKEARPNYPGSSGPQRLGPQSVLPLLSWHKQLSYALSTPFSNAGPWGWGPGLPCTHVFPQWEHTWVLPGPYMLHVFT